MTSIYKHSDPTIAKVLVGNKCDLDADRKVSKSQVRLRGIDLNQAQKIAQEHGMDYFETSAKENINIQEVMVYIMDKVYENLYAKTDDTEGDNQGGGGLRLDRESYIKKPEANGGDCKCFK